MASLSMILMTTSPVAYNKAMSATGRSVRAPSGSSTPSELLWPLPAVNKPRSPSEFELNQGRAIDTLRYDYPRLFDANPDLSLFRDDVIMRMPAGERLLGRAPQVLRGKRQYEKVFAALRFARRTGMQDAEVTYRLTIHGAVIRMRWSAKLHLRDPALGLQRLDIVDGVSVYELDDAGLIRSHTLTNIVLHGNSQPAFASAWTLLGLVPPEGVGEIAYHRRI